METPETEIVLLSIPADCCLNQPGINRFPGRSAPLGLYCLAAVAPQRVAVVDAVSSQAAFDMLPFGSSISVKAVICQASENSDPDKIARFCLRLREILPGVALGVNNQSAAVPVGFDFAVKGTGKSAVLRILRGDKLSGFIDCSHDDASSPLSVPDEPLIDCGYDIFPEKWLYGSTLEIFQPWLGLMDQNTITRTWPGLDWVAGLITWLKKSGFASFHFRPSGLTCDDLHELRSLMLNLKTRFAVSFTTADFINIRQIGWPLQQVWLYVSKPLASDVLRGYLQHIREAGFQACMQINHNWCEIGNSNSLLGLVDRLAFSDYDSWPFADLKRLTAHYWSGKTRFFRRLFSIRSASELVMFMKTSYMMLETILSSEKKAGN